MAALSGLKVGDARLFEMPISSVGPLKDPSDGTLCINMQASLENRRMWSSVPLQAGHRLRIPPASFMECKELLSTGRIWTNHCTFRFKVTVMSFDAVHITLRDSRKEGFNGRVSSHVMTELLRLTRVSYPSVDTIVKTKWFVTGRVRREKDGFVLDPGAQWCFRGVNGNSDGTGSSTLLSHRW